MPKHTVTINAPLTIVRHYLTTADAFERYFAQNALVQPHKGGHVAFVWADGYAHGTFAAFEDDHLRLTWRTADNEDEIDLRLTEQAGSTTITATSTDGASARWHEGLNNLKARLETGHDPRTAHQPRLGVYPEVIVTDPFGAKITGVAPNSGPDHVGLRPNDVIHSIGGVVIDGFGKFSEALAGKSSGDEVDIVFYRDGNRHEARVMLSSTAETAPNLPETTGALAAHYAKRRDETFAELKALFEGATDSEATRPPAKGEWSAVNVVAHLIHTERWAHQMVFNRLNDRPYSAFGANDDLQIAPYSRIHGTIEAALTALHNELERSRLLLAHLPDEALQRRDVYLDVGQGILGNLMHIRAHFSQIKEALAAARRAASAKL